MWFLAPEPGKYGRVLFGFENGWAQGGMNDKGLVFDGIAGEIRDWAPAPELEDYPGNLCERILEVGSTVGDAMAYWAKGDHCRDLARPPDPSGNTMRLDHKTRPVWEIPARDLAEYVGRYSLGPALLTIEQSGDCLLLRSEMIFDATIAFEIVPVAVDEFVARHLAIELTIDRDRYEKIAGLTLTYDGKVHRGRISR